MRCSTRGLACNAFYLNNFLVGSRGATSRCSFVYLCFILHSSVLFHASIWLRTPHTPEFSTGELAPGISFFTSQPIIDRCLLLTTKRCMKFLSSYRVSIHTALFCLIQKLIRQHSTFSHILFILRLQFSTGGLAPGNYGYTIAYHVENCN